MAQELKVYRDPKDGPCWREFYEKSDVDAVIATLKDKLQTAEKQAENLINSPSDMDDKIVRELSALECRLYKFLDDIDTILEYDVLPAHWELMRDKLKKCKQDCEVVYGVVNNGHSLHIHVPYQVKEA